MRLLRSSLLLWMSAPLVRAWQSRTVGSSAAARLTAAALNPFRPATASTPPLPSAQASATCRALSTEASSSVSAEASVDSGGSSSSSPSTVVPFAKPERVVRDPLPVVYVYDHCPFCVRVRLALGLKNVKHTALFLANDDVPTPTRLVGKKVAPIFEWAEAGVCMPESLDIVKLVDADQRFGPTDAIRPATGRTDLKDWQASTRDLLRVLQRPRYVATGLLPEFQQLDGRHAFVSKHELPPYGKEDWRELPLADKLAAYAEAMARDPAADIEELNRKLVELDDIVHCEHHCSPGGVSYDDIDLFSRLRSVTIIRGVQWPAKLRRYMNNFSELGDLPLYDEMAL